MTDCYRGSPCMPIALLPIMCTFPLCPASPVPQIFRHWAELQTITGCKLNLAEDAFKLQHLLDANLLARRCGGTGGGTRAGGQ